MTVSPTPTILFHEHELAPKEIQNLPMCLTLLIRGVAIDNVLVDTGASVCVAPISTLRRCGVKEVELFQSIISISTFDNTRQPSLGAITLIVEIGPLSMPIEFHVVDVESPFNTILGQPWITALNAVPSIAHQCLKFPYEGKVVKLHNVSLPEPDHEENKILAASANEKPLLSITDLSTPGASHSSPPFEKLTPADGWKIMTHLGY